MPKIKIGKLRMVKSEDLESKKSSVSNESEVSQETSPDKIVVGTEPAVMGIKIGIELQKKTEDVKKAELKYIRFKRASGVFAAIGAGLYSCAAVSGAIKSIKDKDLSHGIASGIVGLVGIGLGGAAGFILNDAHLDTKNFKKKYNND